MNNQQKTLIVYWAPGMFVGGGLVQMPDGIKWKPGTDSIRMAAEMKNHPYYIYDNAKKMYVRK